MPVTINNSITSLNAQRRLAQNTNELGRSFERLSSGMRIIRAADDAAGLAVAQSLSNDRRVYNQGVRNLNDGLSYLNIADSAVDQLKTIVTRCRELSTQAANGSMSATQRSSLDLEAQALSQEYNRILGTTKFNGIKVFDETQANFRVQCGYGANESIIAQTGEGVITTDPQRVNTDWSGAQATGNFSFECDVSADGRYVAFASAATNLVAGDTNGLQDIFVKDVLTGQITRVNTDSSGAQATGNHSITPSISADGRYVTFETSAANLVSGDTNGTNDVFVKDLVTGVTTRVSTDSSGAQGNSSSTVGSISADGRYVIFQSFASNLVNGDTNALVDVFVKDLVTGVTTRVSTDSGGAQVTGAGAAEGSISADGRYATFRSTASNLVAGDTNANADVFLKDLLTGQTTRVSTSSSGGQGSSTSLYGSISADGRYVVFESFSPDLVSGDTNGQYDIFMKNLQTGQLTRVSTDSAGGQVTGGSSERASISADGRFVAFYSAATNVVAGDTNAVLDVFVKDTHTGEVRRVSTDSSGTQGSANSWLPSISADGRFVAFQSTATNLTSGDTNGQLDIFLANNTAVSSAAGFSSVVRPLVGITIKDRALAQTAQGTLDEYLNELNTAASFIGSSMNRFSAAVSVVGGLSENISAAESRITDVDVADESSQLLKRNIMQQVGSSILAQANQQPAVALLLLGD